MLCKPTLVLLQLMATQAFLPLLIAFFTALYCGVYFFYVWFGHVEKINERRSRKWIYCVGVGKWKSRSDAFEGLNTDIL